MGGDAMKMFDRVAILTDHTLTEQASALWAVLEFFPPAGRLRPVGPGA